MSEIADFFVKLGIQFDDSGIKKADSMFKGFVVTLGDVVNAAKTVVDWGKKIIMAAGEQEKAQMLLSNAIKLTGNETKTSIDKLSLFATNIQKVTTVGDEATMNLMQLGLQMGIAGDQIENSTMSAIGLSKAFGVDLNTSMKLVALATEGEYSMLGRYIPALRTAKTETEKAAIANDAMAKGFEMAKAERGTFIGQTEALTNRIGDLYETVGMALLPVLNDFFNLVNSAILPVMEKFFSDTKNQAKITETLGNVFTWFIKIGLGVKSAIDLMTDALANYAGIIVGIITLNKDLIKESVAGFKKMGNKISEYGKQFTELENLKVEKTAETETALTEIMRVNSEARTEIKNIESEADKKREIEVEELLAELLESKSKREEDLARNREMWANKFAMVVSDALGIILNAETTTWRSVAAAYGQAIKNMISYLIQQLAAEKIKSVAIAIMNSTVTWGAAAYQIGTVIAASTAAMIGLKSLMNFDKGGIVPGLLGQPQLAIVHGGETIIPPNNIASSIIINVNQVHSRREAHAQAEIIGNEIYREFKRGRKL